MRDDLSGAAPARRQGGARKARAGNGRPEKPEKPGKIDYRLAPQDFFLAVGADPGLSLLDDPGWFWRPVEPAPVSGFPVSRHAGVNERIKALIRRTRQLRHFSRPIEFNSVPVLLEDAEFVKWAVRVGGKWLLNGSSGNRLRNRYAWRNGPEGDRAAIDWLGTLCRADSPVRLPPKAPPPPAAVPVAIEARNTFNFYHFMVETMPLLCAVADHAAGREIFLHYPGTEVRPFVTGFIAAILPEIAAQVRLVPAPSRHDRAISCFNFEHFYFQSPESIVPSLNAYAPVSWAWKDRVADRTSQTTLRMNAFDGALRTLRRKALARLEGRDFGHLPRRFYVARDNSGARDRTMKGEDKVIEALAPMGFEVVHFERLAPIEQIAIMARAEVMVSYHGAGFANMLWAGPQATVIEIGTLQTAAIRWGDFIPLAHVAGCAYVTFFADHNTPEPEEEPDFDIDGIVPVAIHQPAVRRLARFVAAILGEGSGRAGRRELGETVAMLTRSGHRAALLRLLKAQPPAQITASPALMQVMLRCCDAEGDLQGVFFVLEAQRKRGRAGPKLYERLAWVTRRLDRPDLTRACLDDYARRFPTRHAAFVGRVPWFGQFARQAPAQT